MPAHNRGKFKSHLGSSETWIPRTCETCGILFKRKVKNIVLGGGRFCSKRCNPIFAPRSLPADKYRRYNLMANYGMTIADFDRMNAAQNGLCEICGQPPKGKHKRLYVDHNHKTGRVRGLLCCICNLALGKLRDDKAILAQAIKYLEKYDTIGGAK